MEIYLTTSTKIKLKGISENICWCFSVQTDVIQSGEKIRFPECCLDDRYTISEWRYSLKEAAWKDESDIVSYVTPDITVPQGIKVLNIYGESIDHLYIMCFVKQRK